MAYLSAVLSDPVIWLVGGLLGLGLALAMLRLPRAKTRRKILDVYALAYMRTCS